jgi:hypothetical protein
VAFCFLYYIFDVSLLLTDSIDLGSTARAYPAGCWTAILHFDLLGVLDFNLLPTLHTVCLHSALLLKCDKRVSRVRLLVNRFGVQFLDFGMDLA